MSRFLLAFCLSLSAVGSLSAAERPAARTDAVGDPLPVGAIARLGTTRFWHGDKIGAVAFSPDGKIVATSRHFDGIEGAADIKAGEPYYSVRLWDTATGKELRRLVPPTVVVHSLAFSPDGKTLAGADFGRVWTWDLADDKEPRRFDLPYGDTFGEVQFSVDGKTLIARGAYSLDTWDRAGKGKHRLWVSDQSDEGLQASGAAALSPDGTLWTRGRLSRRPKTETDQPPVLLSVSGTVNGKELFQLEFDGSSWRSCCFSPDGKILAVMLHNGLSLYDATTGKRKFPGTISGGKLIYGFTFAPDSKSVATMFKGGEIRIWDVATGQELCILPHVCQGRSCLSFSADGRTLAATADRTVVLWDLRTGQPRPTLPGHRTSVKSMAFSRDGGQLFSVADVLCTWQTDGWQPRSRVKASYDGAVEVDVSPGGRHFVTRKKDRGLFLGEFATGKTLCRLDADKVSQPPDMSAIPHGVMIFSPYGDRLASMTPGDKDWLVKVFDTAASRLLRRLELNDDDYPDSIRYGIVWLPRASSVDGKRLAWLNMWRQVVVADLEQGKILRRLEPVAGADRNGGLPPMLPVVLSPDGRHLATVRDRYGTDDAVLVFEVDTGREVLRLGLSKGAEQSYHTQLAFSPDGRTLAVGRAEGEVRVWEVASGRQRHAFPGHGAAVRCLAFSPDGKTLASGSDDTTILIWDLAGTLGPSRKGPPDARELEALWDDLASSDAARAGKAVHVLKRYPEQAVPLLAARLRPTTSPGPEALARLIADLGDGQYAVRARASQALEELHAVAEPALQGALAKADLETHRRLEKLLARVQGQVMTPSLLRPLRAVEVLESAATPEARRVLQALAEGAPGARLTVEARVALRRLNH